MNKFYGSLMPHYTHNEVFDRCFRARYVDILEAMDWKDKQHEQEKQRWIDKAVEWMDNNVNHYIFENEYGETYIKYTFTEDFIKTMKGE